MRISLIKQIEQEISIIGFGRLNRGEVEELTRRIMAIVRRWRRKK